MQQTDSITFFFPYKEVSGVPILFSRISNYLSSRLNVRCAIVDYADGYMARNMEQNPQLTLLEFADGVPFPTPPETYFIMQSKLPYSLAPELRFHPRTKLVYWNLHPFNLVPGVPIPYVRDYVYGNRLLMGLSLATLLKSARKKTTLLIAQLVKSNSLFFMDESNLETTQDFLGVKIEHPIYLPVVCSELKKNNRRKPPVDCTKGVDAAWVGRLSDFKIHILLYTLRKISEYCRINKFRVTFHVIGTGPFEYLVKREIKDHEYFTLELLGSLENDKVEEYLYEKVALLFAMGTAAIDGGRFGIPTILLDAAYQPIRFDYKFRWLFNTRNFDLAKIIFGGQGSESTLTIDGVFDAVRHDYRTISEKTYSYCEKNHSLPVVCRKLLDVLESSGIFYGDLDPYIFGRGPVMRSFLLMRSLVRSIAGN